MTAIFGVYFYNKIPVELTSLQRMLEISSHQGPDYSGLWNEGPIGLGNCLLRTTTESVSEKLPLLKNNLVLTADARIDNRSELLATLKLSPSISDSELILNTYEKWGENCVQNLVGDFAFVIWDKSNQKLFCARDALGVRPFYYYKGGDFLAFASDPEAIFTLIFVNKQLNREALFNYLTGNFRDSEITEFKNLFRLRPAHTLTVSENSLKYRQYWDVKPDYLLELKNIDEYEELFLDVFKKSIKDRLRTNSNAGVLLSGGLDSSSILCTIEDLRNKNKITQSVSAYSAVFPKESFNEEEYVLSIQKRWGSKIDFISPRLTLPLWQFSELIPSYGLPLITPQFYIFQDLVQKASKNGIKVLLSGHGGDEFMDSSSSLAFELMFSGHPIEALNHINNFAKFHEIKYFNILNYFTRRILAKFIPRDLKEFYNFHEFSKEYTWIQKKHLKEVFDDYRTSPWYLKGKNIRNDLRKTLYSSIHHGYYKRVIEECSRIALNFGSIELRMPFYDRRLVELVFSFPGSIMAYSGKPKGILRKALNSEFPKTILNRRVKSGYTFIMNKELIIKHPEKVNNLLSSPALEDLGFISSKIARAEYDNYCQRNVNQLNRANISTSLWNLLTLESWLQNTFYKSKEQKVNSEIIMSGKRQ
ncbi:MAG: hypothetical protein HY094_09215 [Candidatus Melainabacteria bacterium]|nr:hypothetical protein [Candidatus Melainabacteria bacterium]